ncbi:hypothetical protein [Bradyrhizobium elkanii]|uniref:hypothetical protein n=1 Tax=Bradyrhizobium elkanii TaxID=29448 RepID=UPI0004B3F900|nr:hypothetical protein [Bradyrhizobium elkanii]
MRRKMGGWIVTVAIFKDDSDEDKELRHATYVAAVNDPAEAVKLILKDCGAKAGMLNCQIEEEQLQRPGLQPGKLIAIHDDEIDPITARARRH